MGAGFLLGVTTPFCGGVVLTAALLCARTENAEVYASEKRIVRLACEFPAAAVGKNHKLGAGTTGPGGQKSKCRQGPPPSKDSRVCCQPLQDWFLGQGESLGSGHIAPISVSIFP